MTCGAVDVWCCPMSEMIERVARVLAQVHFNRKKLSWGMEPGRSVMQSDEVAHLVDTYWKNHVEDARAAIAAMREPTEAMAFQGHFEIPDYDPEDADAANVWRAMIDAALSDV